MTDASPLFPNIIRGTYISTKHPVKGVTILVENTTRVDSQDVVTDGKGEYVVDAANFIKGYSIGDSVRVSLKNDRPVYDDNVIVENGRIELK